MRFRHLKRAVRICLFSLAPVSAFAESRTKSDWPNYTWVDIPYVACPGPPQGKPGQPCAALNVRWDQKKEQFINFAYRVNADGNLNIWHSLYNNHETDGDHVCFTALWTDTNNKALYVFHQRWGIDAKRLSRRGVRREQNFLGYLPPEVWGKVKQVNMGWIQCQGRDDKEVARAVAVAAGVGCTALSGNGALCSKATAAAISAIEGSEKLPN